MNRCFTWFLRLASHVHVCILQRSYNEKEMVIGEKSLVWRCHGLRLILTVALFSNIAFQEERQRKCKQQWVSCKSNCPKPGWRSTIFFSTPIGSSHYLHMPRRTYVRIEVALSKYVLHHYGVSLTWEENLIDTLIQIIFFQFFRFLYFRRCFQNSMEDHFCNASGQDRRFKQNKETLK